MRFSILRYLRIITPFCFTWDRVGIKYIFAISGTSLTFSCFYMTICFSLSFSHSVMNSLNFSPNRVFTIKFIIYVCLYLTDISIPLSIWIFIIIVLRQIFLNFWVSFCEFHNFLHCKCFQVWHLNDFDVFAKNILKQ